MAKYALCISSLHVGKARIRYRFRHNNRYRVTQNYIFSNSEELLDQIVFMYIECAKNNEFMPCNNYNPYLTRHKLLSELASIAIKI